MVFKLHRLMKWVNHSVDFCDLGYSQQFNLIAITFIEWLNMWQFMFLFTHFSMQSPRLDLTSRACFLKLNKSIFISSKNIRFRRGKSSFTIHIRCMMRLFVLSWSLLAFSLQYLEKRFDRSLRLFGSIMFSIMNVCEWWNFLAEDRKVFGSRVLKLQQNQIKFKGDHRQKCMIHRESAWERNRC